MKVLKKGNKNYIYYKRCEECGSIISFMKSELDRCHNFHCPVCKNLVYTGIYLYEDDPYLGDEEVKKEVEEYFDNEDKQRTSIENSAYVPNRKEKDEIDDKPKGNVINAEEVKGILEELLREVHADPNRAYYKNPPIKEVPKGFEPYEFRPYEPSKTAPLYGVTTTNP